MEPEDLEKFRKISINNYPNVHALSLPNQALWVLLVAKEQIGSSYLSAWDVAHILTEVYGVSATPPGVLYALRHAGKNVHKKKVHSNRKTGATLFSIMEEGKRTLSSLRSVTFINPTKAFTGLRDFEEVVAGLKGDVYICDPWVDKNTLNVIALIPNQYKIKLLTVNIKDHLSFKRHYDAFNKQYGNLEVRICQKSVLHDRYIISADAMLIIGQSLNGIGKKQTFIIEAGEDIREQMVRVFNQLWVQSKVI